jgi:hypothetical protein
MFLKPSSLCLETEKFSFSHLPLKHHGRIFSAQGWRESRRPFLTIKRE